MCTDTATKCFTVWILQICKDGHFLQLTPSSSLLSYPVDSRKRDIPIIKEEMIKICHHSTPLSGLPHANDDSSSLHQCVRASKTPSPTKQEHLIMDQAAPAEAGCRLGLIFWFYRCTFDTFRLGSVPSPSAHLVSTVSFFRSLLGYLIKETKTSTESLTGSGRWSF